MSRWKQLFGGTSEADGSPTPARRTGDTAFEVFLVDNGLSAIYNETKSARGKEQRHIRDCCKKLLDAYQGQEGQVSTPVTAPLEKQACIEVLEPLKLACTLDAPRIVEPALGCIHKLVAHAYLQAESSHGGKLDDGTLVAQVVTSITKCGENSSEAVQLAVIRALLTITTAEHFVAHGESLMQAVRTVFNIAIGSDSQDIQRTARNALLQMLNTILKRVTLYPLSRRESASAPSKDQAAEQVNASSGQHGRESPMADGGKTSAHQRAANDALQVAQHSSSSQQGDPQEGLPPETAASTSQSGAPGADGSAAGSPQQAAKPAQDSSGPPALKGSHEEEQQPAPLTPEEAAEKATAESMRTARLATLAEQADIRGLEKALDQMDGSWRGTSNAQQPSKPAGPQSGVQAGNDGPAPTAAVQELEQQQAQAGGIAAAKVDGKEGEDSDVRRVLMREKRLSAWRHLKVPERDVLTVFAAVCKMAARETGIGAVESYMHAGKLLALELLVTVLQNKSQDWSNVRTEFCGQFKQPLCLALLRNCVSPYDEAFTAATKLFAAVLMLPKLRSGLKAELGAFLNLLLLRPLETDKPDVSQLKAALEAICTLCAEPQLMVDLFVNFDCDLQAANLFERIVRGVSKAAVREPSTSVFGSSSQAAPKLRELALKALLALLKSLDGWASPIKEAAAAASAADGTVEPSSHDSVGYVARQSDDGSLLVSHANGSAASEEIARFGAAKERKHSLESGISQFNQSPVKGLKALISSGSVRNDPASIAAFLMEHSALLDKTQLGELFGHHEDREVAIMHAYIDLHSYAGLTIDAALRKLLKGFQLPGEAQKIDRIMEKFAERFCRDNPGAFHTADGAYLLSFALIMLNTDAHNPMADKNISAEDFIGMCQSSSEDGVLEPILPPEELTAMYERILRDEFALPDGSRADPKAGKGSGPRPKAAAQLASAMGLTQLMLPFRVGNTWDKQHGVAVERKRLLQHTQELVARGLQAGTFWHTAQNAEHARPMLQVSGEALLKAFQAAFGSAADAAAARTVLDAWSVAIRLAGALGLDRLCEQLVAGLASAAGATAPAAGGSPAEAKQVAALEALVQIAGGAEAGLLGGGWIVVLRTLSTLEALQAAAGAKREVPLPPPAPLTPQVPPPPPAVAPAVAPQRTTSGAQTATFTPTFGGNPHNTFGMSKQVSGDEFLFSTAEEAATGDASANASQPAAASPVASAASNGPLAAAPQAKEGAFSRLMSNIGLGGRSEASPEAVAPVDPSTTHPSAMPTLPLPAIAAGAKTKSAKRPSLARTLSLDRTAGSKLEPGAGMISWAQGSGAEHIEKVYARSGTLNGEAVVIFVRALCAISQEELTPRQPEDPPRVYSLQRLTECAYHNLGRIRLVWGRLWTAMAPHLVSAACHADPGVAAYAVDSLRQLVAKLLAKAERSELTVFMHQDEALRTFVQVLRHCDSPVVRELAVQCIGQAISMHPKALGSGWRSALQALMVAATDPVPAVVNGALTSISLVIESLYRGTGIGHGHFHDCVTAVSLAIRNPGNEELSISAIKLMQTISRRLAESDPQVWKTPALTKTGWRSPASASRRASTSDPALSPRRTADEVASEADHPWALLLGSLAVVARHDPRPRVADAAAQALLEVMQDNCKDWDASSWRASYERAVSYLFELPTPSDESAPASETAAVGWSVEGLDRMRRQGAQHLPSLFGVLVAQYKAAGSAILHQVLTLVVRYILQSEDEAMALLGVNLLQELVGQMAPAADEAAWQAIIAECRRACSARALLVLLAGDVSDSSLDATTEALPGISITGASSAEVIRLRCRTTLLLQHLLDRTHQRCAAHMPAAVQLELLVVLQETVEAAAEFNCDLARRAAAEEVLQPEVDVPVHRQLPSPLPAIVQACMGPAAFHAADGDSPLKGSATAQGAKGRPASGTVPEGGPDSSRLLPNPAAEQAEPSGIQSEVLDSAMDLGGASAASQQAGSTASRQASRTSRASSRVTGRYVSEGGVAQAWDASVEQLLPALMRQEVEGGILLIGALGRCMQQGSQSELQQQAEQHLLAFSRQVIFHAADGAWQTQDKAQASTAAPEGFTWEQAIRAPLVVTILQAYQQVRPQVWAQELPQLFGCFAKLVCSAQPSVRKHLGQLMHMQIPQALN